MTDEETKLARELTAAKQWEWRDGMLAPHPDFRSFRVCLDVDCLSWTVEPNAGAYPDLSDPATKGVLLEMVREALKDPAYSPHTVAGRWFTRHASNAIECQSEGATLALVLLAAWGDDD